jgi:Tfp pilus assembly protein PilZ
MSRRLRLSFTDAAEFREEYQRNILNGGAFVHTAEELDARDLVEIELELGFRGESVVLEAEVVHCLRAEQAGSVEKAGVAVQFLEPVAVLRDSLRRFVEEEASSATEPTGSTPLAEQALLEEDPRKGLEERPALESSRESGVDLAELEPSEVDLVQGGELEDWLDAPVERRKARRVRARVPARVDARSMSLEGRTRDVSEAGVLVSADASGLPTGTAVKLELAHPESGERLEVEGKVSRHVETEGTVAAVAIEFGGTAGGEKLAEFVDDVHRAEKELERAGIYGAIEELGIAALVRMLGTNVRQGTLTLVSGVEEGSIDFEKGMLRCVRLGELRGVKALSRFLAWKKGSFEFHARLGPAEREPVAIALEDAIQEAMRQHEDLIRTERTDILDPTACFAIEGERLLGESGLTKTQEAVLDLVAASFTVRRILDVIPQPDAEVIDALRSLLDGGGIRPV